jgi:hypothetical protein
LTPRPSYLPANPGPLIPGLGESDWLSQFAYGTDFVIASKFDATTKTRYAQIGSPEGERLVELTGPSWKEVAEVRATATAAAGDADAFARDFFRTVAAVPYDGAEPEAARRWASEHVSAAASTVIAGMRFETFVKGPAVRTLRITPVEAKVTPLSTEALGPKAPVAAAKSAGSKPTELAEDNDGADAAALAALLSEAGPLDSAAAVGAFIPRVNDFAASHSNRPVAVAAKREATAMAKLRLAYRAAEAGADLPLRLREVAETFPETAAARAAQAKLAE